MVTAGVFLMCRMSPLMEYAPNALTLVTFVGASTALFAATIGCVQNDIKRIIAYSTCSQLGYMFFAAGVGAYQVAMFHLFTHAFFKALLFLGAGSVIHAMSDEQDIRRMGGIWSKIPVTYAVMWIGSLALAGIPFFAGYYSKDAILEAAFAAHSLVGGYAFLCGILAAFLTAFYSWRLLILTFHGEPRADQHTMEHVHESPVVMLAPLLLLAVGAVLAGLPVLRLLRGRARARLLGRLHRERGAQPRPARHARGPGLGAAGAHRGRRARHRAGLLPLHGGARPAGAARAAARSRRAVPLPVEQVVLRRALRPIFVRPPAARPAVLEGRRRPHHRRACRTAPPTSPLGAAAAPSASRPGAWRTTLRHDHRPRLLRFALHARSPLMNAVGFPCCRC
jgi:hypothetical protein